MVGPSGTSPPTSAARPFRNEHACADRHTAHARAGGLYVHSNHHPDSRTDGVPRSNIIGDCTANIAPDADPPAATYSHHAADHTTNAYTHLRTDPNRHTNRRSDSDADSDADGHPDGHTHA